MTWKDIKLATLQKMFSADGTSIPNDDSTNDYLAAMPYAANEGILMMSTAGKYLVKKISISINPIPNLLGKTTGAKIHQIVSGDIDFTADKAKSYYFEITGKATMTVYVGEDVAETLDISSLDTYTSFANIIENAENKTVKIVFTSEYPYTVKNIALYEAKYDLAEEVPEYAEKARFNMTDLVDDFHNINSIYFEGDIGETRYVKTDEVFQEGDKVLALDRELPGNYIVYYNALPMTITATTPEDYELPLDREVAALLPLYMASQLYKDDDVSIATQYRNEFEVGFERLKDAQPSGKSEEINIESGWV